jgi:hypothetical protein
MTMHDRFLPCALLLLTLATIAATKSSADQRGAAQTVQETQGTTFSCPDKASEKACQSFLELWRAGNKGVRVSTPDAGIAYVCFRQPDDEFFVFHLDAPSFPMHFVQAKGFVTDDGAVSREFGFVNGFKNGVQDVSITPIQFFWGDWHYFPIPREMLPFG